MSNKFDQRERDVAVKEAVIEKFQDKEDHLPKLKFIKAKDIMLLKENREIHAVMKSKVSEKMRYCTT